MFPEIRIPSRIAATVLRELHDFLVPGLTTAEIDGFCEKRIIAHRGNPGLKGYEGFPGSVCTSVNNVAAHGIPGPCVLKEGDILTVDISVEAGGWYGDAAWTYMIGEVSEAVRDLIKASWQSMIAGILAARAGNRLGDIGAAVHRTATRHGYEVLEDFAGHGIGRALHEDPVILHCGEAGTGLPIVSGMVFTIEPVLCTGIPATALSSDKWSCVLAEGELAAQFEHTLAVFADRTEILTHCGRKIRHCIDFPPEF